MKALFVNADETVIILDIQKVQKREPVEYHFGNSKGLWIDADDQKNQWVVEFLKSIRGENVDCGGGI